VPYPDDALASHEELVLRTHPHWWYIAKSALALGVTVVAGSIVAAALGSGVISALIGVVVLVEVVWFVERLIRWQSIFFVLTSDRVMSREGIIAKRGVEIPLERINTVRFEQGIFDRLLGLGSLVIESASTDGAQAFRTVRRPDDIQKQIYVQMERNDARRSTRLGEAIAGAGPDAAGAAATPAPTPVEVIADQITQLATLRDQGHLTPAEFEAKKAELLDRL
jgi:uncharacterized membrane protein YdbT with pleckstrin-like domain